MRLRLFALLALAACSSPAADPTLPSAPSDPQTTASPANIAGAWHGGAYGAWFNASILQSGSEIVVKDRLWIDEQDLSPLGYWMNDGAYADTGTVAGDSIILTSGNAFTGGALHGDTLWLWGVSGSIANGGAAQSGEEPFVRGTAIPSDTIAPAPTGTPALNGVYMSDSLPWTALGQPCLGTIQIDLVIDAAGNGYPQAPAGGYMSTEYDRQCGGTWQAAIANAVVIDSGRVSNGVLSLAEAMLPNGYTGPFTTAGDNWQFQVVSSDSLVDVTPTSINLGWLPPAFVYQPQGFYAQGKIRRVHGKP